MAIIETENRIGVRPAETKKSIPKRALDSFLKSDTGHRVVRRFIGNVFEHGSTRLFDWEGEENIEALRDHIQVGNKILVIANHTSLADAVPVTKILTQARDLGPGLIDGIVYTMAGSMKGGQGFLVKTMFEQGVEPFFEKKGVTPDYVVTVNDRIERNMDRPEDNGKLTREAMVESNIISAVHIEGKTKGGKENPETPGKLFGLQHMDRGFKGILLKQYSDGIPTVILPVMVEGANEFFDPVTKNFTRSGFTTILESLTIGEGTRVGNAMDAVSRSWYGEPMWYRSGTVRVGKPRMLHEIHTRASELDDNVMRLLAQTASTRYLGDYGRSLLAA